MVLSRDDPWFITDPSLCCISIRSFDAPMMLVNDDDDDDDDDVSIVELKIVSTVDGCKDS